jgi:hypothetical protein
LDEHAFGDIVSVVAGGDGGETVGSGVFEQDPISPASPCGLAGCGSFVIVGQVDEFERDLEGRAQPAAEPGVRIRLIAAQTVVDVGGCEPKTEPRVSQEMEQRHRVTTAGERNQQRSSDNTGEGPLEVVDKLTGFHGMNANSVVRRAGRLPSQIRFGRL